MKGAWALIMLGGLLIGDAAVAIALGATAGAWGIVIGRLVIEAPLGLFLLTKGIRRRDRVMEARRRRDD